MRPAVRNYIQKVLLSGIFFFITCPLCNTGLLFGQATLPDSLEVDLDEIRIEATYSSISIGQAPLSLSYRLRTPDEITALPAATMNELTYNLPGVFISNRENYALGERMTIRGLGWRSQFGVRGVQVVMDDIPLTVADGQTIMSMIDPAMVQRIELLRGPSGTFWGNSSGGVVYLSTKPARDAPMFQYRGYGGSYNTLKQELRWNGIMNQSRIYGYASYFDTEGFRDYSAARLFRTGLGSEHQIGTNGQLTFFGTYAAMPKAQHPGSLTRLQSRESPTLARDNFAAAGAGKNFDQAMASAAYIHDFGGGIFALNTHGTWRDLENPLPFGFIQLNRLAGGSRATYQFNELPVDLSIGLEAKFQRDNRLETDNDGGQPGNRVDVDQLETVINQALFARLGIPVSERLTLSTGLRADRLKFSTDDDLAAETDGERNFLALNPSAGLSYKFNQSRFFVNFSTSFESPTTTELVNRPEGGNGFNQNLNPERALSAETGVSGQSRKGGLRYDLTLFAMQVRELLVPFQNDPDGPTFFRNEGRTRHYGVEATSEVSFAPNWTWNVMVSLLEATFQSGEFDGNDVPGVTPFRAGSSISYQPGSHFLQLQTEWLGSYYADSDNTEKNKPYALLHLRWTMNNLFNLKSASIKPFVSVQNILDTRYNSSIAINAFGNRFYEPGSGRNFMAGFQIDL